MSAKQSKPQGNPFRPTPGSEPPVLVGREVQLSAAGNAIGATRQGDPAQPILCTGLRGLGKTALLRRCLSEALDQGAVVVYAEAEKGVPLAHSLERALQQAKRDVASLPQRIRNALDQVIKSLPTASYTFPHDMGSVQISARADHQEHQSFTASLEELNHAVRQHGRFLVLAVDEIQDAPVDGGLRDIAMFIHFTADRLQAREPAWFMGAGLPETNEHLREARTYTARWRYFRLELLTPAESRRAIAEPLEERKIAIDPTALDELVDLSGGYPYFVQEFAAGAWAQHEGDKITLADVRASAPGVQGLLDNEFYATAFNRLTNREIAYALALAALGPGGHTLQEVAASLGTRSELISSIRSQLIKKDIIYAPAATMIDFRIPLTERFIQSHEAELRRRAAGYTFRRTR